MEIKQYGLQNKWVTKEIKGGKKKSLEEIENRDSRIKNQQDAAK